MSYEVLVNLDEGVVGEVYTVRPPEFVWGSRERAAYGRWLVIEVDATEDADTVEPLLDVWEEVEEPMPEDDPDYDPDNPLTLPMLYRRWRLRLSEFDADRVNTAWAAGTLALTATEFENACESYDRRRFDPAADDGQGELWPDAADPKPVEPTLPAEGSD